MICVSIREPDFEKCMDLAGKYDFTEIRMDGTGYSGEQIRKLFSVEGRRIATFRPGDVPDEARGKALMTAISAGADYVDIELEAPRDFREGILSLARGQGSSVIISYHNYDETPDGAALYKTMERCFECGADIAKIACMVETEIECARILSLYNSMYGSEGKLVAIGMGEMGRITRVASTLLGAPFTYASPIPGVNTAPGQIDYQTLKSIIEHVR